MDNYKKLWHAVRVPEPEPAVRWDGSFVQVLTKPVDLTACGIICDRVRLEVPGTDKSVKGVECEGESCRACSEYRLIPLPDDTPEGAAATRAYQDGERRKHAHMQPSQWDPAHEIDEGDFPRRFTDAMEPPEESEAL